MCNQHNFNSFWENIILARGLEVLKSIYLFRLTFQTNTVRHQNITKLKCQDVKLDQLSRCQNEKVRVKTANKDCTTNKCWGEKGGKDNIGLQIPGSKSWTHKCKGKWRINYWGPPKVDSFALVMLLSLYVWLTWPTIWLS